MPPFTVLHTADWHLGARLREMDRAEEHAAFLEWLTAVAAAEDADLLVIAGDVFDSANPPQSAMRMWYDFLAGFRQRCPRCPVVAVAGNHDSPAVLEAASGPLAGLAVHLTGEAPAGSPLTARVFPDKSGKPALAVAAVPFLRDRDLRSGGGAETAGEIQAQLCAAIRDRYAAIAETLRGHKAAGCAVLVTGHLTVAGSSVTDSEREIHIGNLGAVGADIFPLELDYIALGHLHRPQGCGGGERVRYSGSPVALSFSEWRDAKEVRVLTFENGALTGSRALTVPCARPLVRVNTSITSLETDLEGVVIPASTLPAWVEVTVAATSGTAAELTERVHAALAPRGAAVLAVRRMSPAAAAELTETTTAAAIQDLQPAAVFDAVLQAGGIPEEEQPALRLVFQQLLERHQESPTAAAAGAPS